MNPSRLLLISILTGLVAFHLHHRLTIASCDHVSVSDNNLAPSFSSFDDLGLKPDVAELARQKFQTPVVSVGGRIDLQVPNNLSPFDEFLIWSGLSSVYSWDIKWI